MKETLIHRFENTVKENPDAIAIVDSQGVLTYADLNAQANSLAHILLLSDGLVSSKKIKSVHLLFEHGSDMIVAMLAVLKCGYCYIPLDPDYPIARTKAILDDSEASVVLTNSTNIKKAGILADSNGHKLTVLNINNTESHKVSCKNLDIEISPDQLAYVLYTSGSTGKPKGVIQNQQNVLHFVKCYSKNLTISKNDKLTGLSSYTFDASVMSIYGALLNGAALYLYDLKIMGLIDLLDWLQKNQITIYHSTPTVFRYFTDTLNDNDYIKNIRLIVLGGEVMLRSDVELYKKYFSNKAVLINGLGPSESTVTLQYFITNTTAISSATIPVGYPVENTEVFIVNAKEEIINDGEIGELVICSDHLALGYLNLPVKSKAVFLENFLQNGSRAYKTGDLCRRLDNGAIEFFGRSDFQVKIRGHRVELNEIEYAIDKINGIKKSIVTTFMKEGENVIIAYYTAAAGIHFDAAQLSNEARKLLPEYMIPSYFMYTRQFPCTDTRKIDRKKLYKKNEFLFDSCFQ